MAHWVATAVWYCAPGAVYDHNTPSPPLTLFEVIARTRAYNAELGTGPDENNAEQIEAAMDQLHAAGEVWRCEDGRWIFVPYDLSIFCDDETRPTDHRRGSNQ